MVESHPKCVVQSYLQWLKDSDWDSRCSLCKTDLQLQHCVRLVCYHVFHWSCLDEYAGKLPANTAPAGYACPECHQPILPPVNLVSAVADQLRSQLASSDWARPGSRLVLGGVEKFASSVVTSNDGLHVENEQTAVQHLQLSTSSTASDLSDTDRSVSQIDSSIIDVGGSTHYREHYQPGDGGRLVEECHPFTTIDSDSSENKYRRRVPLERLHRWLRRMGCFSWSGRVRSIRRRSTLFPLLAAVALVALLSLLRFMLIDKDQKSDIFDPLSNPNIHVRE